MAAVLQSTLSAFLQPGRAAGPARFGPAKAGGLIVFWGNYKVGRGNFKVWGDSKVWGEAFGIEEGQEKTTCTTKINRLY